MSIDYVAVNGMPALNSGPAHRGVARPGTAELVVGRGLYEWFEELRKARDGVVQRCCGEFLEKLWLMDRAIDFPFIFKQRDNVEIYAGKSMSGIARYLSGDLHIDWSNRQ